MAEPELREPTFDEEDKISDAIVDDDVDKLQNFLKREINVNSRFQYFGYDGLSHGTPLHWTAIYDGTNCARLLISTFKADMNITDSRGQTPLQLAIDRNKNGMVYLLVEEYNQQLLHLSQEEKVEAQRLIEQYEKENFVYMLLEDSLQKRSLANLIRGRISKGELVHMTKSNQWSVAYSDPPIFVDFQMNQAKPVKPQLAPYLLAVENLFSRYNLFNKRDSLIKCMLLNVGDKVDVTLEQQIIPSAAIIRYKGEIPKKRGIFYGVEILDKDKFGDTDGTFFQERKFSCPANKGLFVSVDKIQAKLSDSFILEYAKQSACGLAPSRTFKVTFVGPEGSGKSSSIRTLLGKKFNPNEVSTIGAVLGIRAMINWFVGNKTTENEGDVFKLQSHHTIGWKEAAVDTMQLLLGNEFNKEMTLALNSFKSKTDLEPGAELMPPISQSNDLALNLKESNNEDDESSDDCEELDNIQKETFVSQIDSEQYSQVKSVMFGKKIDKLDSHACISDFAGQDTYFSFQLFFLKKHDTVIITFNASLDLTAKIIPRERYNHAKKKRLAAGMMTTIENLEFWLQSVSAHAGTSNVPYGCMSRRSPTAILCGTHAEKLSSAKMDSIVQIVLDYFKRKPYIDHLPTDRTKAVIFISNKNRKKFKHNIVKLQKVLLEAATPACSEERPISYLKLEQLIALKAEKNIPMISVEEFTALVNQAGIPGDSNSEAVMAALQYSSTRGTILYFPEVEILSKIVFISPHWLSSIFSTIITTHNQVVDEHPLYHAWEKYDKCAILEERFLDHILETASASEHKNIIVSLMELFNLIAEIPSGIYFTDDSVPPTSDERIYIVPALLLYDPDLPISIPKSADQIYIFHFSELYFPESAFNQTIVKMIRWNVQNQFKIIRIHHGLGYFSLGNSQTYCLIYEPNNYALKVCIAQSDKDINREEKRKAYKLFVQLMLYLEESIHSIISLYLPSTKPPVLHIFCPKCCDNTPHIMLEEAGRISLNLPTQFCTKSGQYKKLLRSSYLPFGDELSDEKPGNQNEISTTELTESAVLQQFFKDLQNEIPLDNFLPQLVTKKIITITDKLQITEHSKSVNERCQYFLDQFISKPILAGDPSAFYKLLQLMETSSQCIVLAARMKQCLMVGSLENKFAEVSSSDTSVEKQLPELDALIAFYNKICKTLPVDELLPELVSHCVITKDNKTRIAVSGKTESERTQYLLDNYIARPLLAGDPSFFHKLLHVMSSSPKCNYLINDIQHHLSTTTNYQKFSGHQHEYTTTVIPGGKSRNDKPTIQELSQCVIHQYAAQWKDLGAQLGLKDYEIANIASDYRNQCVEACREMLMLWLRNISSPTWGNLDDTIKSMKAILSSNPSGSSAPPTNVH